jgi:histidinol-phosphate aminotransferase
MSLVTPRQGILDVSPYVGGESSLPGVNRVVKLASNENPLGCSPRAQAAYTALGDQLHLYPDGGHGELRQAIGRRYGLDHQRIVCGAGSDELLALLGRAYAGPGDEVIYSQYGFLMYPIVARTAGATPVMAPEKNLTADVDAILERATPRTKLVFLANPNNPTGSYLPAGEMARLRRGLPESALLIIDAAYAEYVTAADYEPGVALVDAAPNTVMTRTFSKIHGLAALRLGWAYCPADVADVLHRVRGPFNVTAPALAAGVAAIEDQAFADRSLQHNARWLPWLSERLRALGLVVPPSAGNFILVRFPADPRRNADAALRHLNARGVIPRRMAGYGLPDSLRISIGLEEDMRLVADALGEFMAG